MFLIRSADLKYGVTCRHRVIKSAGRYIRSVIPKPYLSGICITVTNPYYVIILYLDQMVERVAAITGHIRFKALYIQKLHFRSINKGCDISLVIIPV